MSLFSHFHLMIASAAALMSAADAGAQANVRPLVKPCFDQADQIGFQDTVQVEMRYDRPVDSRPINVEVTRIINLTDEARGVPDEWLADCLISQAPLQFAVVDYLQPVSELINAKGVLTFEFGGA